LSAAFGIALTLTNHATPSFIPLEEWESDVGDRVIVDTQMNMLYMIHSNGSYTATRSASGRRHMVSYLGSYYNASTPLGKFVALSYHKQPKGATFGNGDFLRLYRDGIAYTRYGIHSTSNIDTLLSYDDDERYFSYGCVLVSTHVEQILIDAFNLNGQELEVYIVHGIDWSLVADNATI
jgi:hypothetical protein